MIDISLWMDKFLKALTDCFGERVWFVGLQGSYARGEATESSDIDTVVILDTLQCPDIEKYNAMLDTLPNRKQICGFLSGKDELMNWEPSDLFQFYFDTTPIKGTLDELAKKIDKTAVRRAIRSGACNIYHGCVHNFLHEKSDDILRGLYKNASFVAQAIHYEKTGAYVRQLSDLIKVLNDTDSKIVEMYLDLKNGGKVYFYVLSMVLFNWSQDLIKTYGD